MFTTVLVLLLAVATYPGMIFGAMQCNDCQFVLNCPEAYRLAAKNDPASQQRLREVFCGFQAGKPRVCCGALSANNNNDGDLDNHPSLALLPQECGFINGDFIVGGKAAGLYQFPWMVLISHKTHKYCNPFPCKTKLLYKCRGRCQIGDSLQFGCGGTLINKRYVLTAAHCIKNLDIAGVRIGEYDYRTTTDCEGEPPKVICEDKIQDIRVEQAIIHPDYSGKPGPVINDIGLLRLKKDVRLTPSGRIGNAKPICLPITSELRSRRVYGANATLAGWGFAEDHAPSPVLLTVKVPVHTAEECRFNYYKGKNPQGEDLSVNKLCAGEYGKDSCSGDSGGPLMISGIHNNNNRFIQYGIVSSGPRNCGSGAGGFYTDVTKYMKFILDNIKP